MRYNENDLAWLGRNGKAFRHAGGWVLPVADAADLAVAERRVRDLPPDAREAAGRYLERRRTALAGRAKPLKNTPMDQTYGGSLSKEVLPGAGTGYPDLYDNVGLDRSHVGRVGVARRSAEEAYRTLHDLERELLDRHYGSRDDDDPDGDDQQDGSSSGGNPNSGGYLGTGDATGSVSSKAPSELRVAGVSDGVATVTGVIAPFGVWTTIWDGSGPFRESIAPGAFDGVLEQSVPLLVNHDQQSGSGVPIARTTSGTLRLRTGARGLLFSADLALDSPLAQSVVSAVRRGDLHGCSFAFVLNEDGDRWSASGTHRTLTSVATLADCSLVTTPAYSTGTSVKLRSAEQMRAWAREEVLRIRMKGGAMVKPEKDETDLTDEERELREAAERRRALMEKHGIRQYRDLLRRSDGSLEPERRGR